MSQITSTISQINFFDFLNYLSNAKIYDYLFPFLLIYAVLFVVLGSIKIFKNKDGTKNKSVIVIISLVVALFGVSFETSPGFTVGKYLMMLFPNVSAFSIAILGLYLVGSIINKNFFGGLFGPKHSAFLYYAIGVIGLGSVLYYLGIAMGFISYNTITSQLYYWNTIIGIGFIILGFVFLFTGSMSIGLILLLVTGVFFFNYNSNKFILSYFLDPIIFIWIIVILLLGWMKTDEEKITALDKDIKETADFLSKYKKRLGKEPDPYKYRIYGQMLDSLNSLKKKKKR